MNHVRELGQHKNRMFHPAVRRQHFRRSGRVQTTGRSDLLGRLAVHLAQHRGAHANHLRSGLEHRPAEMDVTTAAYITSMCGPRPIRLRGL
jgi:hypothetical protein